MSDQKLRQALKENKDIGVAQRKTIEGKLLDFVIYNRRTTRPIVSGFKTREEAVKCLEDAEI